MTNFPDSKQYYQILEADINDDANALKSKYFRLAKFWHPDHNTSENAMENFQKLSVAYDILKDDKSRLYYNLLSLAYNEKDFPDMKTITPFLNSHKTIDLSIRCINIKRVIGKLYKSIEINDSRILNYYEAKNLLFKTAIKNWLFGWLSLTGFSKIKQAISANMNVYETNRFNNFKLFIHNIVALHMEGKISQAYLLAKLAKNYTSDLYQIQMLDDFIISTNISSSQILPEWDYAQLKRVQYFMPAIFGIVLLLSVLIPSFSDFHFTHKAREISYNQTVKGVFGNTFDDVVVGKIINFPSEKNDTSMLYHINKTTNVMYGPDDNFDVATTLESGHTVRITGKTPDNAWYRIMIDNGEDVFVRAKFLAKGIGNEIPATSKIFKE